MKFRHGMAGGKGHLHEELNGLMQGGYSEVLTQSKGYRLYPDSPVAHVFLSDVTTPACCKHRFMQRFLVISRTKRCSVGSWWLLLLMHLIPHDDAEIRSTFNSLISLSRGKVGIIQWKYYSAYFILHL